MSSPDFGFVPLSGSSFPRELVAFGSQLYFVANDGLNGFELWSINDLGEESSLRRISNLLDNKRSSSPEELTIAGDSLYFTANDGKKNRKLYQFNDNLSEPKAVENSGLNPRNLSEVDGQLFDQQNPMKAESSGLSLAAQPNAFKTSIQVWLFLSRQFHNHYEKNKRGKTKDPLLHCR